ncbi:MAG: hypothetical protein VB118_09320 [Oscillospiraceae bacterium]|nr:hypothetical protein [Oscillospiraceae bacterium]
MKILENVDTYRVKEPLFEGVRVIMNYLGETYTSEYIQGISGAAFRIATGCPSRPTCCMMMWSTDLIKLLGYEYSEYPCFGPDGEKLTDNMITAIRQQIDAGKPALVWHAMTSAEWDVVCGYDEINKIFFGRGSYWGPESAEYHTESWDRAEKAVEVCPAFGAVLIGEKTGNFDAKRAEINALTDAVSHARTINDEPEKGGWYSYEGIQALKKWHEAYSNSGKDRDLADAYCFDIYSSVHSAAPGFLREISCHFPESAKQLLNKAAEYMEEEAKVFKSCAPYLGWNSPWGVNEERSKSVAPLLEKVAMLYEKAIECIEQSLNLLNIT